MGEARPHGQVAALGRWALLAPRGDSGQPTGPWVPGSCPEHSEPCVSMQGMGQPRLTPTASPFDTDAALVPGQSSSGCRCSPSLSDAFVSRMSSLRPSCDSSILS